MKLAFVGALMFLAGLSSIVLQIIGYELSGFSWLNNLGVVIAWLIRIGLVIGGAVLFLKYWGEDDESSTSYFT